MLEKDLLKRQLAESALISVYSKLSKSPKRCRPEEQNKILAEFFKKAVKAPKYGSVKKDASTMLNVARKNPRALEEITKYHQSLVDDQCRVGKNDFNKLYSLLNSLEMLGWRSMTLEIDGDKPTQRDTLFVLPSHIDHCFSDDGIQCAPLSLLVKTTRFAVLWGLLKTACEFECELKQGNDETNNYHILLHPKGYKPE